ncbi:MAG: hypothetical protein LBQ54_16610 [Planctomycetaceae bacterium]|jgi:hypothetical protein|nr:hypothetical protein [Planctomycetaceae bacterium]
MREPLLSQEADELMRNAELRAELEPYYDESISCVNVRHLPLRNENEFLAAMLAWETAPILPIYRWFEPELRLPLPDTLNDKELSRIMYDVIDRLYEKNIVLDFTDHLNDRELYRLIIRDILPSREKKLEQRTGELRWDCSAVDNDPCVWLKYYASESERLAWANLYGQPVPPKEFPPYLRQMPHHPF